MLISLRKWWPLVAALTAIIAVGMGFYLLRGHADAPVRHSSPPAHAETTPAPADPGRGGESADYYAVPKEATDTATKVARLLVGWSKKDDIVSRPSIDRLERAGMSGECAQGYSPVWESVFASAHTGAPEPLGQEPMVSVAVESVNGEPGARVYELTADVKIQPWWIDASGAGQSFPSETDTWRLTYDERRGLVTRIVEPDPLLDLSFRIPENLVAPTGEK